MSDRIIKSYVWHGDECFFVSTLERDSSAIEYPHRYNETMVWNYDWHKALRQELIHQDEDSKGSIRTHQRICEQLFFGGLPAIQDDE